MPPMNYPLMLGDVFAPAAGHAIELALGSAAIGLTQLDEIDGVEIPCPLDPFAKTDSMDAVTDIEIGADGCRRCYQQRRWWHVSVAWTNVIGRHGHDAYPSVMATVRNSEYNIGSAQRASENENVDGNVRVRALHVHGVHERLGLEPGLGPALEPERPEHVPGLEHYSDSRWHLQLQQTMPVAVPKDSDGLYIEPAALLGLDSWR